MLLLLAACGRAADVAPSVVTIMTFNLQNLFDNADDPGKNDRTFMAAAYKLSDEHKRECAKIPVQKWRDECLYLDWNDQIIEKKLAAIAAAIKQVDNGRGPDILMLQEVENVTIL